MTYKRLTFQEREEISRLLAIKESISSIAIILNRNKSTISREIYKNEYNKKTYRAYSANKEACRKKKLKGRKEKLVVNKKLRKIVLKWLRQKWSPEQIVNRLKMEYKNDKSMRISHETIYRYLYVIPKGELRKELIENLRRKQKFRRKRSSNIEMRGTIPEMVSIDERPEEVEDRKIPGHWEGDLILGKERKCVMGTLIERTTRFTLLVKLENRSPSLVKEGFVKAFKRISKDMKISLTYDQGAEMIRHKLFTKETKIKVYFAHTGSPWERGTNENTNGLIRQYFPKSTDFKEVTEKEIKYIQNELNDRPRKCLGFMKPKEVFFKLLH
jgi:IS30 family transposase